MLEKDNINTKRNLNIEMSQTLLDIARQRFEQEATHAESLDSKAGSLIGYSGIIATFIGFLFSSNIITVNPAYKGVLITGVILSLLSILCALIILVPLRKTRDVFLVDDFVNDFENSKEEDQIKEALNAYQVLIESANKRNSTSALILYIGNILLGIGVLISFISIFL